MLLHHVASLAVLTTVRCRARKPFHPQKLYDFVQQNFVLQEQEVYEDMEVEGDALQVIIPCLHILSHCCQC